MNNLNNLYRRQMENKAMKGEQSLNHLDHHSEELKLNRVSPVKEESVNVEDLNDCNHVNSKEIVPASEHNLTDNSTNARSSPPVHKCEENGESNKVNESQEPSSRPSSNCSTSSNN